MFKKIISEKTLLDKMIEAKNNHGIALISYFNNGKVRTDVNYDTFYLQYANDDNAFHILESSLYNMTEAYARDFDFDSINMKLELGLMYYGDQIDENKNLKENAKPIENVVRYYTGSMDCLLDDEKTNDYDYGSWHGRQGYIGYEKLLESIRNNELDFDGPKTFNEFKEKILSGEKFDINLSASLKQKEEPKRFIKRR